MQVPLELQTDRVSNAILKLDPEGHAAVEWTDKKPRTSKPMSHDVKLIIQPDDGLTPLLQAVRHAKTKIDIVIFRFDRAELEKALEAAVARGVVVRALIAHTNRGGEKSLRKLELRLLAAGVTVARTADDLPRYHGKMMIVDDDALRARLQLHQARHREEPQLRHRDHGHEAGEGGHRALRGRQHAPAVLAAATTASSSARRARAKLLTEFIKGAKKQLLIYDAKISDALMLKALQERAKAGVEIRVIGKVDKKRSRRSRRASCPTCGCTCGRSSATAPRRSSAARACASWSSTAGARSASSSARRAIAKKIQAVFEADWAKTLTKAEVEERRREGNEKAEKDEKASDFRLSRLRLPPRDHARVDHFPGARDRVEVQLVAVDLRDQERLLVSNADRREAGAAIDVSLPQLAARSDDEVGDALLRLDPLVDVVVSREDDADAVLEEQRLEHLAQFERSEPCRSPDE